MTTWNPITKATGTIYTNVGNPKGKQIYDDPNILYDDKNAFYDSTNVLQWTAITNPKIIENVPGNPIGLLLALTYSTISETSGTIWTDIPKPT